MAYLKTLGVEEVVVRRGRARCRDKNSVCSPCRRKAVSNVHCGAIPSQSGRIHGVAHQHSAFAGRTREFRDLEQTYTRLAENEEWMEVHTDKMIPLRKNYDNRTAFAEEEEQILKCLGAAVLMRCNTVPTKLQRDWQFWGFPAGRPESVKIDHFQRTRRCCARSAAGPRVERRPRGIAAPELPRLWGPPAAEFSSQG
jgi:hypothetical protein